MVGLGDLAEGGYESVAFDVSADGSVVVGYGTSGSGHRAFLWTADLGMVDLRQFLNSGGAAGLTGWMLNEARAISSDGRTVVGWGTNPQGQTEAWIATVPEPSGCLVAAVTAAAILRRKRTVTGRPGRSRFQSTGQLP
jgi:probable HAF family extracellular repeat protein